MATIPRKMIFTRPKEKYRHDNSGVLSAESIAGDYGPTLWATESHWMARHPESWAPDSLGIDWADIDEGERVAWSVKATGPAFDPRPGANLSVLLDRGEAASIELHREEAPHGLAGHAAIEYCGDILAVLTDETGEHHWTVRADWLTALESLHEHKDLAWFGDMNTLRPIVLRSTTRAYHANRTVRDLPATTEALIMPVRCA